MEVTEMSDRFDMVQFLKDLRSGKKVICPKCRKGHFVPVGDYKTARGFNCSECGNPVIID